MGLTAVLELSLIATSGGYSLASVLGLLTAVVSLVAKHRLYRAGSVVVVYTGLVALPHWNHPGPGVNQCPLPRGSRGGSEGRRDPTRPV